MGLHMALAGVATAGTCPNPSISFSPISHSDTVGGRSPRTLGFTFSIPIKIAGKCGYRIAQAEHLSEFACLNIPSVAWQVRSRLRKGLVDFDAAHLMRLLLDKLECR